MIHTSKLYKEISKAFWIGVAIFILLCGFRILNGNAIAFDINLLIQFGYNQLYSITIYMLNYFCIIYFLKTYSPFFKWKPLILTFLATVGVTLSGIFLIRIIIEIFISGSTFNQFISTESPITYWLALSISSIVTITFFVVYYNRQKHAVEVKTQKIIAGTASARFNALKNQLDPHFLFNSLNVLTSLIDEDSKKAQYFTTSLSKVYRYVLDQKSKELVSVDEELHFARTYSNLLKMRFENGVIFDIPDAAINSEAKVVPLSLQLLLENAVKHNSVSNKHPLRIEIIEEGGHLTVKNNLQEKKVMGLRQGVGLANIKERYNLLTDRGVQIVKTPSTFEVRLPLLTKQISEYSVTLNQEPMEVNTYLEAKEQVKKLKEFYGNLTSYCIVIPFLAYINYITIGWTFMWFLFPLLGWGLGLLFHGMEVFDWNPFLGRDWQERKIKEYMKNTNEKRN